MKKPIINPSTLSDEQREAIRQTFVEIEQYWRNAPNYAGTYGALCQLELMENLFGSEFFKKGE